MELDERLVDILLEELDEILLTKKDSDRSE